MPVSGSPVGVGPYRRYPESMSRRPEVELSDAAARWVEEHPAAVEKLAAGVSSTDEFELRQRIRTRIRTRLHEAREYAASPEGQAEADAFLAKYNLSR